MPSHFDLANCCHLRRICIGLGHVWCTISNDAASYHRLAMSGGHHARSSSTGYTPTRLPMFQPSAAVINQFNPLNRVSTILLRFGEEIRCDHDKGSLPQQRRIFLYRLNLSSLGVPYHSRQRSLVSLTPISPASPLTLNQQVGTSHIRSCITSATGYRGGLTSQQINKDYAIQTSNGPKGPRLHLHLLPLFGLLTWTLSMTTPLLHHQTMS
jgi:hypothetical protein